MKTTSGWYHVLLFYFLIVFVWFTWFHGWVFIRVKEIWLIFYLSSCNLMGWHIFWVVDVIRLVITVIVVVMVGLQFGGFWCSIKWFLNSVVSLSWKVPNVIFPHVGCTSFFCAIYKDKIRNRRRFHKRIGNCYYGTFAWVQDLYYGTETEDLYYDDLYIVLFWLC